MYIIYLLIYGIISFTTSFGFEYTNGFELLWGSCITAAITLIIDKIIFKFAYDWTKFFSNLCEYNTDDRKTTHWKFRVFFSIPVLIFSLTPLCSIVMTPLVHSSFVYVSGLYQNLLRQISDAMIASIV